MKTKIITIICVVLSKLSFGQYEQYIQYVTPYLSDSIQSGFFYFNTPNNFQAGQLYQLYRQNAPDLNNNMVLTDQHVDSLVGLTHFKYQQTFMDIPIEGAGCIEHYDLNGSLLFINAKVADSINKSHEPRISRNEAIYSLLGFLSEDERIVFAWEDEDWEKQIQLDYDDSSATWYPTSELIWAVDTLKDIHLITPGSRYSLAYKISVTTIEPSHETFVYYLDAHNGAVLKVRSAHIHDGPAGVYGYGSKIIDTQWKGGFTQKYILKTNDATRRIHTKTCNECTWGTAPEIKDGDDNWGNTYLTETSTHYHVSNAWDYFRNVFGRVGMNGGSAEIRVKTQLGLPNAFFNGNNGFPELVFGKDSGWDWGMEPSVVAHEFTHGVTSSSSDLQYEYESGAVNESFSDIFGVVIHAVMLDGGSTDWIMGNHVPTAPTRSLEDPNSMGQHWLGTYDAYGNPEFGLGQPDTYGGDFWCSCPYDVDNGGVHLNSGVQNKWFYVLAHGDDGINDLSNYYDVDGIGMTKAARISYYALTSLLMNSSQYSDSRQATIQAAKILFGECSVEHQNTIDAWYAVGIGSLHSCTYTISVDEINELDLLIYPNPTTQYLNIELPYRTNENIKIYDLTGKIVKEFNNDNLTFQSDISSLDSGVYTICFSFNGKVISKRFIVQK